MELSPGVKFDRYTIESELGEGGMGRVYRAHDPKLDRAIALKVLRVDPEAADSRGSDGARLVREARAAAALNHPNIVSIFDVGEVDGVPFIAMELVRGKTLRALMHDPVVPLASKLRWLADVARALATAHEHGLVHRDIKPGNVIVREDGVVKVLDFGIARRTVSSSERPAEPPTVTEAGKLIGTPQYMAPEQVRGGTPIDGRVDQFAWGVLAFELLTGRLPWLEVGGVEVLAAILHQDVVSPHMLVPGLPEQAGAIIVRALAKDREARFASMSDVAVALEPFATGTPIPVTPSAPEPVTVLERGRASTRRNKRSPRTVAIGVLAVGVAGAGIAIALGLRGGGNAESTPVTELPLPTTNGEALAAYREAMQAYRDGIFDADVRGFERAIALDPTLAAAHLRLSYILFPGNETDARAHYERASQLRESLSPHEQILLDAFEPYIRREPADVAETERRLRVACDRFPRDPDFALYYANARFHVGVDPGTEAFERAVELDPKFGNAYSYIVEKKLYLGDVDGAVAVAETCLREVPSATRCALVRGMSDIVRGNCQRVDDDARRSIAIDPSSTRAYRYLAAAELALGRPVQTAQEALEQAWDRIAEKPARQRTELVDRYALDVLRGDFAAAEQHARALESLVATSASRAAHATVARELVDVYEELGRTDDAAAVADDFLRRQGAWIGDPRAENFAIGRDATIDMLAMLVRAGKLAPAEFDTQRAAWADRWRKTMKPRFVPFIWIHGYAAPARQADEAAAALAAMPAYRPIDQYHPHTFADGDIGRTFVLAGKLDDGLRYLRTAAASCLATEFPIAHTRGELALGQALETRGDTAGACAAYRVVLDRWGATPSVTAEQARTRAHALACR